MRMSAMLLTSISSFFFFSSRRRHTRSLCDWSSDVCSSDLLEWLDRGWTDLKEIRSAGLAHGALIAILGAVLLMLGSTHLRSEERRVGKECRSRWGPND